MRDTTASRELLERDMLAKPVSSLQYMLDQLSRTYHFLPQLAADGVYGERTLEAVMRFQKEAGLPVTGRVDQTTWNAIRDAWLALRGDPGPGGGHKRVSDRPPDHVQHPGPEVPGHHHL